MGGGPAVNRPVMNGAEEVRWSAETLFAGPGETRAKLRETDWARTPLGPVESWPAELRAAIRTVLPSEIPMLLWWGPELVQIFNDAYTSMIGAKYPEAVAQPARQCWPEVWDEVGPLAEHVLAGGAANYAENQRLFMRRHGYLEETYWTFSYSPIAGEDGSVAGILVATTDVTATVLGNRRLDTLRELGTLSIAAADTADDACRAAVAMLARQRTDLPVVMAYLRTDILAEGDELRLVASVGVGEDGRGPVEVLVSVTTGPPEVWRVAESGQPEQVHGRAARQLGVFRSGGRLEPGRVDEALLLPLQVSGRARPVGVLVVGTSPYRELDEPYRAFVGLVADRVSTALTDALAYAGERRRNAALAELDQAKTRFFSNVSHELRTPLTLIAGPVEESLADGAHPLPPAQRERLEMVRRNTGRLRRLVDNVLDVVRSESGRLPARKEPTDLAAQTRGIADSFEFVMHRAGLRFVVDAPALPRTARVDRDMWEKIVANLLSNALKFTLTGEVRLSLSDGGDEAVLAVSDTGVGIAADQQPLLFERFHRVRGNAARSQEGAGIGLALVSELVDLHGGSVGVASEPGVGSTFTVRIPYGEPASTATPVGQSSVQRYVDESVRWLPEAGELPAAGGVLEAGKLPAATPAAPSAEGANTVLVVEDNPDLRTFLTTLLAPHWHVEVAADGQAALERIEAVQPDLVLTDVMMPRMDGFELLGRLRGDPRTALVPVVMLSGRAGQESALEGLDAGADDYLVKPFSSQELLARVRTNLELAKLRNDESAWRTAITDSLQEAFCILADDGAVLEVNDAFRRLLGFDVLPSPVMPPYPWWPDAGDEPAEHQQAEAALRNLLASGSGRTRIPLRRADGRGLWVEAVFSSFRDTDTGRRTYVSTLRDITDELLAAERQAVLTRLSNRLAEARDTRDVLAAGMVELQQLFAAQHAIVVSRDGSGRPAVMMGAGPVVDTVRQAMAGTVSDHETHVDTDDAGRVRWIGALVDAGQPPTAVWLQFEPARAMPDSDRSRFLMVCGTISHALQRAKIYDVQRTVALTLQRSILGPAELPAGFAVRYEPAVEPLEVGGDWYDVIQLPDDEVGVVVGDCVGRGLVAAAVMGQLRSACRALLLQAKGPGEVLTALDDFARMIPGAGSTTVFCAIIHQATGRVRYSVAGHPPAILQHPDGDHELLDGVRSIPLATLPVGTRPEQMAQLRAGSTLLLYTDGLIERRRESLDVGIARAVRAVTEGPARQAAALADHVVTATRPDAGYDDDTALLVYHRAERAPFAMSISARATELKGLRSAAKRWLADADVPADRAGEMLIAVGEACANAIEHAYRFDSQEQVSVQLSVDDGQLRAVVSDTGSWVEPADGRPDVRGHGRRIMEAFMDDVAIEGGPNGTTVRLMKEIHHGG